MTSAGGPGFPGEPVGQVHASQAGPMPPPGYQPRVERGAVADIPPRSRSRKGLILAAVAAVVVIGAGVAVVLFTGSDSGPEAVTKTFFAAVKAKDGASAEKVTCPQAANLGEHLGDEVSKEEPNFGTWNKTTVDKADSVKDQQAVVGFDLDFAKTTVHGRSILVKQDDSWVVCSIDFDQPKTKQ